jgi:parvulin-like peptidyl-prolyl isomerase
MSLWTRLIALLAALAFAVAAAGCGGDDDSQSADVPADAVAVVGDTEIPKTDYDNLLAQAQKTFEQRDQEFPEAGTPEFAQLRAAIVRTLVEQAEYEIAAEELDVTVTDEEVQKRLDELKDQYFDGDDEAYQAELAKTGQTEEQVLATLRTRLLAEKIFKEITSEVEVTDQDVQAYYEENKAQFEQPASREVRHVLVKTKAKADQIHQQLENGADFARLARQFSTDESSAKQGGNFTAQKGATVPPFDKAAFELETGELSQPVKTQFGWHVIEATDDVVPASTTPLADVQEQISATLLDQKKNTRIQEWVQELQARYADQVSYAPGFEPPPEAETTTGATDTQPE